MLRRDPSQRLVIPALGHVGIRVLLLLLGGSVQAAEPLPGMAPTEAMRAARAWNLAGDARLRGDFVRDLPAGRADLRRGRSFLRLGIAWTPNAPVEAGVGCRAALGSDRNRDLRRNFDNEKNDDFDLDVLFVRIMTGHDGTLALGKAPLPLALTAMVWDEDLRPIGAAWTQRLSRRDYDALVYGLGWFDVPHVQAGKHLFDVPDAQLAAAQIGWLWHDGAPWSAEARGAFLRFDALEELAAHGLARTNSVHAGTYAHDFRLLDLQVAARAAVGALPCEVRFDLAQNLGSDAANRALRAQVVAGDRAARGHVEVGYVFQRLERDAVLAAFDSDDWWFHSAARGHRLTAGVGLSTHASVRGSVFLERRDDLDTWTKRLLADLRLVF